MRDSQIRFIRTLGYPGTEFTDSFYSAVLFQPRAVGAVVVLGVLLQSGWVFASLAAALWWSTAFPTLNLFDAIYNHVIATPRGLPLLGVAPAPRRFAQGMAGSVGLLISVSLFSGTTLVAWMFEAVFVVASTAAVFRDSCAGADVYHLLRKRHTLYGKVN